MNKKKRGATTDQAQCRCSGRGSESIDEAADYSSRLVWTTRSHVGGIALRQQIVGEELAAGVLAAIRPSVPYHT